MDPLKKLVADRLKAQVAGPHPDAEVLSAFAENALPASERETVLQHLSTCADCRETTFLAVPVAAESQPIVTAPKTRPVFALRWGTLAACVAIAAVFLVSRRQTPQNEQFAKRVPQTTSSSAPAPAATDTIVAAEKAPAELTEMRNKLPAKAAVPASATTGHAEPKHITAKPEENMSFADSGEVSVNAPAAVEAKVEPRTVKELQVNGRNAADLKEMSPSAAPLANARIATGTGVSGGAVVGAVGGPTRANAYSYGAVLNDLAAKKDSAFHGSVNGTIFDASGAVIPNAQVTALGPVGSRTVTADQAGKYSLDQLAVGNYQFQFKASGFREAELTQVAVLADKPANVDIKLMPGAATETVSVEAAAPEVVQEAQQQVTAHTAQQGAFATDQQQQSANQIQEQELTVEAAPTKVPKAAKGKTRTGAAVQPVPALARAVAVPVWQWSLSSQGVVQRSVDNGKTWQPVSVAAGATFRAVSSLLNHIWAGGKSGVLYHSADSGQHWIQVVPTTGADKLQGDITQVQLVDPQDVVLTTSNSETWATADGGQTWSRR